MFGLLQCSFTFCIKYHEFLVFQASLAFLKILSEDPYVSSHGEDSIGSLKGLKIS
jgi:hypothetical protein